ncbi:hypothetical protein CCR83_14645 [Rhodobacter veldkampii DSM 11550]|uniref:AAA+ family ATPase n=1 Tax=Phaeovulum veldkampii DSM 11550 TaxID=1185920 RepID=A0A2T4JC46_9RHOB|nr:AAA+ family ATPase [Phaeovulum veldkampii]MBK5947650.1 hypothetical protein [Phaeovulum veldkampii DSM 11550]NCU20470.1 AAA+ family ATPase [Candidatus Falkowbacteria bacterium]PTE15485.1 AAA+ family ATPase [Phaeovulum veldkampii DSM 11550]TDQ56112.1 hypothetical protein EV658_12214 [Phaeovulum veldkampii DSM 11550]
MTRFALALSLLLLAVPALAEGPVAPVEPAPPLDGEVGKGFSLMEEGAKLLFRGLIDEIEPSLGEIQRGFDEAMAEFEPAFRDLARMIGDIKNYEAPVKLPNGDILIRRKPASLPPASGEMEL